MDMLCSTHRCIAQVVGGSLACCAKEAVLRAVHPDATFKVVMNGARFFERFEITKPALPPQRSAFDFDRIAREVAQALRFFFDPLATVVTVKSLLDQVPPEAIEIRVYHTPSTGLVAISWAVADEDGRIAEHVREAMVDDGCGPSIP